MKNWPSPFINICLSARFLVAFALFFAQHVCLAQTANDSKSEVQGKLLIIGGGLRYDNVDIWKRLVNEAGGSNAKIAVIPTASANPNKTGNLVVENLKAYGAQAFLVPLSERLRDSEGKPSIESVSNDPQWAEKIKHATGIYLTGGDQNRITRALYTKQGQRTPLLEAMWDMYRRGGIIAGTSAGAAIMSETMFTDAGSVLQTLQRGAQHDREYGRGLGFIGPGILVDQHLIIRGRFARMLPVMQATGIPLGLGIDENTAMLIDRQRRMEVIGYKGSIVIEMDQQPSKPQVHTTQPFAAHDLRIHYLSDGDQLDLQTRQISPAPDKELLTETQSEEADQQMDMVSNILANTAVVELMSQLIESPAHEMIGMAFDVDPKAKSRWGFRMRFSKTADSRGYFSSKTGMEAYTVIGLKLDVTPLKVRQPLFVRVGAGHTSDTKKSNTP